MFQKKQIEAEIREQIAQEFLQYDSNAWVSVLQAAAIARGPEEDKSLQERIAQAIERDEFWKSKELSDAQVHVALAMRIRIAAMVRNFDGRPQRYTYICLHMWMQDV